MGRFTTSDGDIFYEERGPSGGPALVLAHPLAANLHFWDPQVAELSKTMRVVRFDLRGHGNSHARVPANTLADHGQDVIDLLDRLEIGYAHFCGLSLGGMLGMWLAANSAARFGKFALCHCLPYLGNPDVWSQRIEAARTDGLGTLATASAGRWLSPGFAAAHPETVASLIGAFRSTPEAGYIAACTILRDEDLRNSLPAVLAPVMAIGGTADQATPLQGIVDWASRLPATRVVSLDAGHFSNIEQPARFNARLLEFFAT